ncbi:unnamed protein product [Knipowitschia caucasica]|uniref:SH3 domain-containing protein n=1 Tax=Knipowitschia caucasica TaxID=637954 RepID=A0AAV2LSH2_KNICA
MRRATNGVSRGAELGAVGHLQSEMLHMELIDGGPERLDPPRASSSRETTATPPLLPPVTMDTYRPKRPTTLALISIVPRTQDTLNNNSFGKKFSWQEKVSGSPQKTGERTPPREHSCLSDEDKVQSAQTKDRGTSTDAPCRHHHSASSSSTRSKDKVPAPPPPPPPQNYTPAPLYPSSKASAEPPTEEIYLTPVRRSSSDAVLDSAAPDRPFLAQQTEQGRMSISSDTEGPPPYQPLPDRTDQCIFEEDEIYAPPPSYASCVESLITPPRSATHGLDLSLKTSSALGIFRAGSSVEYVDATDDSYCEEEDEDEMVMTMEDGRRKSNEELALLPTTTLRTSLSSEARGLTYDSVKYTLVVDEHAQLELVSLRQCYQGYSDDSDSATVYDNCVSPPYESALGEEEYEDEEVDGARVGGVRREGTACLSDDSSTDGDLHFSKKFLNVFLNGRSSSSSAESFGLFSCLINGEEREQTHRAVYRFVPRHEDELELEVDDPLFVEVQAEDFWFEGLNMRTGARGVFPAYYAMEAAREPDKVTSGEWMDRYRLKFLGSVQVPYHKGNDVLCAAMQKIATNRRMTVKYNPPSSCLLEIDVKGIKLSVQEDYYSCDGSNECNHFFQLKNVSFCGYHPKNSRYFGFITKHPADQRFACHVFVSENSTKAIAESVG